MRPLLPHRIRPWYPPRTDAHPLRRPVSATPIYDQLAADLGFDPLEEGPR